jgi:DNA-binding cell septation regulator SpoVG
MVVVGNGDDGLFVCVRMRKKAKEKFADAVNVGGKAYRDR